MERRLDVPKRWNGNFTDQDKEKSNKRQIEIEDKILSLFALGNSYSQNMQIYRGFFIAGFLKQQ